MSYRPPGNSLIKAADWFGDAGDVGEPPDRTKERRDRCIPVICKSPGGCCFSISTSQPFFTAWATLPKCLFHIKDDAAQTVTLINAFKNTPSSALSPSPFLTKHSERKIRRRGGGGGGGGRRCRRERWDRLLPVVGNCIRRAPSVGQKKENTEVLGFKTSWCRGVDFCFPPATESDKCDDATEP